MKRSTAVVLIAVIAVLGIAWALDPIFHISQNAYLGGLAATFAGVLAGLPLALLVDRLRQRQEEQAKVVAAAEAATEARNAENRRLSEILGLVRAELTEDLAMLDVRTSTPWEVRPPFLRSDVWHALNASGATIGVPAVLVEQIARTYHLVEATSLVEREVFRVGLDPLVRTIQWGSVEAAGSGPSPLAEARNVLSRTDGATRQAIQESLGIIAVAKAFDL